MQGQYFHLNIYKKSFYYFLAGLLLLLAALFIWTKSVGATPGYTPYAKSVKSSSAGVINSDNAVGPPNGTTTQMVGANSILTLDVGEGEEGTQSLKVYFGQVNALVTMNVDFLDANQTVISSENRQVSVDANSSTQTFAYNWSSFGKAYRYVRLSSSVIGAGVNVDAVEKLGYIGATATQDLDGDGVPDRTEVQNGTNPLVADSKPASGTTIGTGTTSYNTTGTTTNNGSGTTNNAGNGTQTGTSSTNTTKPSGLQRVFGSGASLKHISGWEWFWILLLILAAMIAWWQALKTNAKKPKATKKLSTRTA